MKFFRAIPAAVLSALLGLGGSSLAQQTPPVLSPMHQGDLVQVVPNGLAGAQSVYASPGAIGGQESVSYQVPVTGFSITIPNNISLLFLNPAGTLATGTIIMPAVPNDGQRVCWTSNQIQTAVTVSANTGQTLAGAATETAGAVGSRYCRTYIALTATWYHYADA
jgi:hypothetical protein